MLYWYCWHFSLFCSILDLFLLLFQPFLIPLGSMGPGPTNRMLASLVRRQRWSSGHFRGEMLSARCVSRGCWLSKPGLLLHIFSCQNSSLFWVTIDPSYWGCNSVMLSEREWRTTTCLIQFHLNTNNFFILNHVHLFMILAFLFSLFENNLLYGKLRKTFFQLAETTFSEIIIIFPFLSWN